MYRAYSTLPPNVAFIPLFLSEVTRTSIISPVHLFPAPCGLAVRPTCLLVRLAVVRWSALAPQLVSGYTGP